MPEYARSAGNDRDPGNDYRTLESLPSTHQGRDRPGDFGPSLGRRLDGVGIVPGEVFGVPGAFPGVPLILPFALDRHGAEP